MAQAAAEGAGDGARLMRAEEVRADHLFDAGGYLFICPENLASMSGAMKEMFDQNYYLVLGRVEGRPYATAIAAGSDGEGAQRQIDRIATGWRLRRVADPIIVNCSAETPKEILAPKIIGEDKLILCRNIGQSLAEGISLGVF